MNVGGYRVLETVQDSATAAVYKVQHPTLQSFHACKIVPKVIADIPSVRAAFLSRAQWSINNQSPFAVRVTDVVETETQLGLIMDWLEGETLRVYLDKFRQVSVHPALRWGVQVLAALHVLHTDGMVHGDLTPHNIFLQQDRTGAMAILMDAGIHRHLQGDADRFPLRLSRLRYLAPEEVHKRSPVGPWTDVYAIGTIIYEMLVGRPLYEGQTDYSIMHAIQGGTFSALDKLLPELPTGVADIVHKALHKDPTKRYASAAEMMAAIHATIELPDHESPVPIKEQEEVPAVDVLIEQDGEWVLQSASYVPEVMEEVSEEIEAVAAPPIVLPRWFKSKRWKALLWRLRYVISGTTLLLLAGLLLFLGGALTGRTTDISIDAAPTWGGMKVSLDQEPLRGRTESRQLSLGDHSISILGGMFEPGGCGRCCWTDQTTFGIPFGWGRYEYRVDLARRTSLLQCPTVEQAYLFEKVNPIQAWMGAPYDMPMRGDNALWHQVTLTKGFWMGKTEVTQDLYQQVMRTSEPGDGRLPKRSITWLEAIDFCNHLSEIEGLEECYQIQGDDVTWETGIDCKGYRLPTEAEWELAAKAEQALMVDGKYTWFAGGGNASLLAWYSPNAQQKVQPVGGKYPNAFGLYDMSGNVAEWTWDGYTPHLRDGVNPKGVNARNKTVRGGHFLSPLTQIRVFDRGYANQGYRSETIGFRIVRSR